MQILNDEHVKMGITVQQMVFNNSSGEIIARKVMTENDWFYQQHVDTKPLIVD